MKKFIDNPVWRDTPQSKYEPVKPLTKEDFERLYLGTWECPKPLYYSVGMMDMMTDHLRKLGFKIKWVGEYSFEAGGMLFIFTDKISEETS